MISSDINTRFLEDAVDIVTEIGRSLQHPLDQLGVYTTHPTLINSPLEGPRQDCELLTLSSPNLSMIKRVFENISGRDERNDAPSSLESALERANNNLLTLNYHSNQTLRCGTRAIIIISANSIPDTEHMPATDSETSLHLISPRIIPNQQGPLAKFDWYMNHYMSSEMVPNKKTHCDESEIRKLVATARLRPNVGTMSAIEVQIIPGSETDIQGIFGDRTVSTLLPGQHHHLVAHLNLQAVESAFDTDESSIAMLDVERELGCRKLATVAVRYKHSRFPENTTLEAKEVLWISRPVDTQFDTHYGGGRDYQRYDQGGVNQAMAMQIVTNLPPEIARSELDSWAIECGLSDDFVKMVQAELSEHGSRGHDETLSTSSRYTSSIKGRMAHVLPRSNQPSIVQYLHKLRDKRVSEMDAETEIETETGTYDSEELNETEWNHYDSESPSPRNRPKAESDEARRVWHEIFWWRKGGGGGEVTLPASAMKLREQALRNQRSVGTATLRSCFKRV